MDTYWRTALTRSQRLQRCHRLTIGDMKVPTFYSKDNDMIDPLGFFIFFPVVSIIFGGIHCAGWFDFPSSDEAMLWRMLLVLVVFDDSQFTRFGIPVLTLLQSSYQHM